MKHYYIIRFQESGAYSPPFDSEKAAMEYIIDNGYNFKKKEKEKAFTTFFVSGGKGNYKLIKNHYQKCKEIPGYEKQFYKDLYCDPPFDLEPPKPQIANDPEFEEQDNYGLWGKDFKNLIDNSLYNKNTKAKKKYTKKYTKKDTKKHSYYIYDKGKLGEKKKFDNLTQLSDYLMNKQAFIVSMKEISPMTSYIWIVHYEDVITFLPDSKIVKRFEEIIENRINKFDYSEDDPYEHLEI